MGNQLRVASAPESIDETLASTEGTCTLCEFIWTEGITRAECDISSWSCEEIEEMLIRYGYNDDIVQLLKQDQVDGIKYLKLTEQGT